MSTAAILPTHDRTRQRVAQRLRQLGKEITLRRILFLGGPTFIAAGVVLSGAGIFVDDDTLWRLGVLGMLVGLASIVAGMALLQKSVKRDTALARDRTLGIAKSARGINSGVKRLDNAVSHGALSHLPSQIARTAQSLTRLEHGLNELHSEWSDLTQKTSGDFERFRSENRSLHELLLTNVVENQQTVKQLWESHQTVKQLWEEAIQGLSETLQGLMETIDGQPSLADLQQGLSRNFNDHYRQLESLLALYEILQSVRPMPPMRDWATSPDLGRFLVEHILRERPAHILEIGSGSSTVLMAAAARLNGFGHVTAVEHLQQFADETNQRLAEASLQEWATVRETDLVPRHIGTKTWAWYDIESETLQTPVNLLVVDGPPQSTGEYARYPAVPLLYDTLAHDAVIVLDDYHRPAETAVVEMWMEQYSALDLAMPTHEKGTAVLLRKSAPKEVGD